MRLAIAGCVLMLTGVAGIRAGGEGREAERLPVQISGEQKLPEFADVTAWINSKPLTAAGLRGKVVVVHFMTFG